VQGQGTTQGAATTPPGAGSRPAPLSHSARTPGHAEPTPQTPAPHGAAHNPTRGYGSGTHHRATPTLDRGHQRTHIRKAAAEAGGRWFETARGAQPSGGGVLSHSSTLPLSRDCPHHDPGRAPWSSWIGFRKKKNWPVRIGRDPRGRTFVPKGEFLAHRGHIWAGQIAGCWAAFPGRPIGEPFLGVRPREKAEGMVIDPLPRGGDATSPAGPSGAISLSVPQRGGGLGVQ